MKKYVQVAISVSLGLFLIWLLFRHTDWKAVYATIRGVRVWWLVLAQVFAWSSYFARAQRWSYVVRAAHPATFRSLFSATQIGFLVNFTVPFRVGEVVRGYVLARLTKLPFAQCVSMVGLDRVSDLFALLVVLFIAVASFPSDKSVAIAAGVFNNADPFVVTSTLLRPAATSLTVFLCVVSLVLVVLYMNQTFVLCLIDICAGMISKRLGGRLQRLFLNFAAGMHVFRSAAELAKSACFSLLTQAGGILSTAAVLTAFSIDFPWFTPFLVLAMVAVFISVPVTPGVVGQYHIPIVACLLLAIPGMEPSEAKAVAIVAHILCLIPIAVLGVFCLF